MRSIRPSSCSSWNALPKALELPRFPPGTTIQSGTSQPQRFQHAEHDRLLPFQPEGIDAVDQVDAQLLADFLDAGHGVVEIAGDLHGQRAVVERLRELAVGDLARADEDHGLHQPRDRAVEGQRGAGVAGRGAGGARGADEPGVAEGGRHAVVLEAARGVHPLVLQEQAAGPGRRTGPRRRRACSSVCPSPMVTTTAAEANGSSSWNRHTPLKTAGRCGATISSRKSRATWGAAAGPSRRPRPAGCRTTRRQPESRRCRTSPGRRAKCTAEKRHQSTWQR